MDPSIRERIFKQELKRLDDRDYLSTEIIETVLDAYEQYNHDLLKEVNNQPLKKESKVVSKPVKVRKVLSAEEIRERNITWSLNIGVIFLLIGGLFVATSNWESMSSLMKSGSIGVVSILFYAIAYLANKVLRIHKTAFAFIVLGSLFLPIFILSLGWFGLLGSYLSISGEGKYLLGVFGSFIPSMAYIIFAEKLRSRLFVWFTFIFITAGVSFTFASFHLKVDGFYLGIMAFNALMVLLFHKFKEKESLKLFTKEYVVFAQVNLVLSTLFMLFIYDHHLLYGFNLILTAMIYLSMIYVTGKKEFHFIFSIMIVYGVYQLVEYSALESINGIVFALLGFGLVFVPKVLKGNLSLEKAFQYTSAVISCLAFLYISLEGMRLKMNDPSISLMIAYLIISGNFMYLASLNVRRMFPYLSSFFLASAIFEGILLMDESLIHIQFPLALFFDGFLILLVGMIEFSPTAKLIQKSSRDIGNIIMILAVLVAFIFSYSWELGVILLFIAASAFLLLKKEERLFYKKITLWIIPSSIGLSIVAFGEELSMNSAIYRREFGDSVHFALGAILILLSSLVWKKLHEKALATISLQLSQVFYTIAMLFVLTSPIHHIWLQPCILFFGIWMYYVLKRSTTFILAPYLVSFTTLLFYYSVFYAISIKVEFSDLLYSLLHSGGALMLLGLALMFRKRDKGLFQSYIWVGHSFYPLALLMIWFVFNSYVIPNFLIALFVYALSTKMAKKEWLISLFLYSSFTTILIGMASFFDQFPIGHTSFYEFPVTSLLLLTFWQFANLKYKKITVFYVVPFSIMGLIMMITTYPFGVIPFVITFVYAIVFLYFLHKVGWSLIGIIPLLLTLIATIEYCYVGNMDDLQKMLLSGSIGTFLFLIGKMVYPKLVVNAEKIQEIRVDGFTLVSFFYLFFMYYFENDSLWTHLLPGILISSGIFLQKNKVDSNYSFIPQLLGIAYLLEPYYSVIRELDVPVLWGREVIVLPWILLVIFIRRMLKDRFEKETSMIQWAVLILVSLLLVQDGLESSTIYDAIILGSLSFVSMLSGMFLRVKSFFFVGTGVLLLNVLLQTRPYWGNMPWWGYLLITGSILIIVASSNEWHKQKSAKGEKTFITMWKEKIVHKMKEWN